VSKPFHNPFASLDKLSGITPAPSPASEPAPATNPKSPDSGDPKIPKGPPRAVVRMQRAGRGGKDVTFIEHLDLPARDREAWTKDLKAALGCGGKVEDDAIVLQGDQRKRLPALLTARGVRKIVVA
jgi:translation initiation factor 1